MSPDAVWVAPADGHLRSAAEPYRLPNGWAWAALGALGTWMGGGTPSKSVAAHWANGSVPWVSPKDMKTEIIRDTEDHITEAAVASSATKFVAPGSVLMVMRSGILRHTFPVAVNEVRVTLNQDLRALAPAGDIEPRYIAHYLRGVQRQVLHDCSKDGTTVQSVEVAALERVRVPLAPLPEQRRIVARIDELFAEIAEGEAALERARRGLDTWRRALLKAAVTGELSRDWRIANPPTETAAAILARIRAERAASLPKYARGNGRSMREPFDLELLPGLPEGWLWVPLSEFLRAIEAGLNVKASGRPPEGTEIGIVKISAVTWGEFNERKSKTLPVGTVYRETNLIRPGDFLFSRANTLELVGSPVIVKHCSRRLVLSDKVLRLNFVGQMDRWIEIFLKSPYGRLQIEAYAQGNQLSMRNISQENIGRIRIPLPPDPELRFTLHLYDVVAAEGAAGHEQVSAWGKLGVALRQSILKSAFEGRLVPQDPADEPASALLARLREGATKASSRRTGRPRESAQGAFLL